MTELETLAEHALRKAKRMLQSTGHINLLVCWRKPDGTIEQQELPDELAPAMNIGRLKDLIFGAVRLRVQQEGLTAVMFASDSFVGQATAKGALLSNEEFLARTGEHGFEGAVIDGLVIRREAIVVSVQTPEGAHITRQYYRRDDGAQQVTFEECETYNMATDEFSGRQKMYGDLSAKNLR